MPQSLSFVLIHVIFATKGRAPTINDSVRPHLHAYLATVVRNLGSECYRAGGTADHVHLAIRLSRNTTVSDLVQEVKTSSSRWLKKQSISDFVWQRGYGAFSVGPTDLDALVHYIDIQEAHHHKQDFQEEFRAFLKKYGVAFDERYVWD